MRHFQFLLTRRPRSAGYGLLMLGLSCSLAEAGPAYLLEPGDTIEIAIAGLPELRQRLKIQIDGSISMPRLGTLTVAGSTEAEARAKIQSVLATKVFRQRSPDGQERPFTVEIDDISASTVEYRPIYVSGDVSRPGEQAFRPHMTVRQAVASSGGYDPTRHRAGINHDAIELQGEYAAKWAAFAKEHVRIWRLKSELGETSELDEKSLSSIPLPRATITEIVNVASEQLRTRHAEQAREKEYLERAITQADQHITILTSQLEKEEKGVQADAEDVQRITKLFEKGAVAIPRVSDARRAALLSSTRWLQTQAQLMQVTRQRTDLSRQLEKAADERMIAVLKEMQDAVVHQTEIRARLLAIGEKLQVAKALPILGDPGKKVEIAVFRRSVNGRTQFVANDDAELQPGDVIEVTLRPTGQGVAAMVLR